MNIMELGILFVQFSNIKENQRDTYLKQHPEISNTEMIDWAVMAAQMREPEDKKRIANAALYLAIKIKDKYRQSQLRQILSDV